MMLKQYRKILFCFILNTRGFKYTKRQSRVSPLDGFKIPAVSLVVDK